MSPSNCTLISMLRNDALFQIRLLDNLCVFVCTLCFAETPNSLQGEANLQLWDVQSGQLIKALFQKKIESW